MAARALILGCNGFVGDWLARELVGHGYEVDGADVAMVAAHSSIGTYHSCDVLDEGRVAKVVTANSYDVVINLAAISSVGQSWRMPQATMQVNVVGTINVLEAARIAVSRPKVLLIGSSEQYAPSLVPLTEESPIDANNPYGISKMTQERFAQLYREQFGLRVYLARSFNHTGPGQRPAFVVPSWCKQVAEIDRLGGTGTMRVGNLDVRRDISDVRDIVRGYRLLLESDFAGEPFNFGSGNAVALREVLATITSFAHASIAYEIDQSLVRPTDTPCICCNRDKAGRLLGWEPQIALENTLRDVYETMLGKG